MYPFAYCNRRPTGAFTLVELMMVIGIIVLLASIAVPAYERVRLRSQAARIMQDLRIIDSALDQYATDYNKSSGALVAFVDLQPYIKTGSSLYLSGADLFGVPYGPFSVDFLPQVSPSTYNALSDVTTPGFWSPYGP